MVRGHQNSVNGYTTFDSIKDYTTMCNEGNPVMHPFKANRIQPFPPYLSQHKRGSV